MTNCKLLAGSGHSHRQKRCWHILALKSDIWILVATIFLKSTAQISADWYGDISDWYGSRHTATGATAPV